MVSSSMVGGTKADPAEAAEGKQPGPHQPHWRDDFIPQSAHQRNENYPQADVILPWSAETSLGQLFTGQTTLQSPQNSDGHLRTLFKPVSSSDIKFL